MNFGERHASGFSAPGDRRRMFDGAIKLTHCFAGVRYSLLGLPKLVIVNYYSVNWQLFIGLTISGSRPTFQFSVTSKNLRSSLGSSTAVEDYLERILELINSKGYARVVDIAAALKISQASVTNMVQRLDAEG